MIERAIENWLVKTNERNYLTPFCQILMHKGHRIIYKSSHRPMEQGKDIITIDKSGNYCAYQLKTGNIDLPKWREIRPEIEELIQLPIIHPSINKTEMHKSFLVFNGNLTDEVRIQIDQINEDNIRKNRNYSYLDIIDVQSLLKDFIEAQGKFMPEEVEEFSLFLKLHLADGRDFLDKETLSAFLNSAILNTSLKRKSDIYHCIVSSVIVTSYILNPFQEKENHYALFEAWIVLCGSLHRYALIMNLKYEEYQSTYELILSEAVYDLKQLLEEALFREDFLEGDLMGDGDLMYKARVTLLVGAFAALELFKKSANGDYNIDPKAIDFIDRQLTGCWLWGESAFPFFMNVIHLYDIIGHHSKATKLLLNILVSVLRSNSHRKTENTPLANPYYGVYEILEALYGFQEENIDFTIFSGSSYILEPIISMMARRDMRFELEELWRPITHIHIEKFLIDKIEDVFSWRTKSCENTGQFPQQTQSWAKLRKDSFNEIANSSSLMDYKRFFRLFLMVYPHRVNCQTVALLEPENE